MRHLIADFDLGPKSAWGKWSTVAFQVSRDLPRSPFLDNFRIADHTLGIVESSSAGNTAGELWTGIYYTVDSICYWLYASRVFGERKLQDAYVADCAVRSACHAHRASPISRYHSGGAATVLGPSERYWRGCDCGQAIVRAPLRAVSRYRRQGWARAWSQSSTARPCARRHGSKVNNLGWHFA